MLRAMEKTPETVHLWIDELNKTQGENSALDQAVAKLKNELIDFREMKYPARHIIEQMVLTMQSSLLIQTGNNLVADGFIQSCLGAHGDRNYGTLPRWIDCQVIIDRGNSLPP